MFVRRQPLIEAMDRAAEWLWTPVLRFLKVDTLEDLQLSTGRARSFRVLPLVLLLGCSAGLGGMIAGWRITGLMILNASWVMTALIQTRSPLMGRPNGRDEREAALVRSGHLWGLGAATILALIGCFYVNRRSKVTPYRRAKGPPLRDGRFIDAGRKFRSAGGVGRA